MLLGGRPVSRGVDGLSTWYAFPTACLPAVIQGLPPPWQLAVVALLRWWLLASALAVTWWVIALVLSWPISSPFLDFTESSG